LFKPGGVEKTPSEAVEADAKHWKKYWQLPKAEWSAHTVIANLRDSCLSGLRLNATDNKFDMPKFTSKNLFDSAKTYKKVSKGSDHWLSSEILLPDEVLEPIAEAIDFSVCSLAWPHQMLFQLMPELGKAAGGFRTIGKTPKSTDFGPEAVGNQLMNGKSRLTNHTTLPVRVAVLLWLRLTEQSLLKLPTGTNVNVVVLFSI
jgi:hypothetical protein